MNSVRPRSSLLIIVLTFAVGVSACKSSSQSTVVVEVPAGSQWVDTGIDLNGKPIEIKYQSGNWSTDGKDSNLTDGEGQMPTKEDWRDVIPHLLVPQMPLGCMVGKTNETTFFVGNTYEGNPGVGRLYLSINENPAAFADNTGTLKVEVKILN
jgi:hypothetical protein